MAYQNSTVPFEKMLMKICVGRRTHVIDAQMAL